MCQLRTKIFLRYTGSMPPPQSAPTGYSYDQGPKPNYDNFSTNRDDAHETSARDTFADYSSFSDKAVRRGFIRKVRHNIKDFCTSGHLI